MTRSYEPGPVEVVTRAARVLTERDRGTRARRAARAAIDAASIEDAGAAWRELTSAAQYLAGRGDNALARRWARAARLLAAQRPAVLEQVR